MARHVVSRPLRHANDQQVRAYGATLAAIFDDWIKLSAVHGVSPASLIARLQGAAAANYSAAYLRGKRQAFPGSDLTVTDKTWIAARLQRNEHYLGDSLTADITDKLIRQQLRPQDPDFSDVVRKGFRSRIQQGYGGDLWTVTEAGFRSGISDLKRAIIHRQAQRSIGQEDGEDQPAKPGDHHLAAALGLGLAALLALLGGRKASPAVQPEAQNVPVDAGGIRIGTKYNSEEDDATCPGCDGAATGGDDGIYWDDADVPLPGEFECLSSCRCWLSTVFEAA